MFKRELTVPAEVGQLEAVTDFVNGCLEELNCPPRAQMQIDIAVDELFGNIAHYAYPSGTGTATVRVESKEDGVVLTFLDTGTPYDPLSREDPDITLSAEDRPIGGLGIYMVKKSMNSVSYSFQDGKNVLKIVKKF